MTGFPLPVALAGQEHCPPEPGSSHDGIVYNGDHYVAALESYLMAVESHPCPLHTTFWTWKGVVKMGFLAAAEDTPYRRLTRDLERELDRIGGYAWFDWQDLDCPLNTLSRAATDTMGPAGDDYRKALLRVAAARLQPVYAKLLEGLDREAMDRLFAESFDPAWCRVDPGLDRVMRAYFAGAYRGGPG